MRDGKGMPVEYVMVPVPEQVAQDTKQFIAGLDVRTQAEQAAVNFNAKAADRAIGALNPRCRRALSLVAEVVAAGSRPSVQDIAKRADWAEHDTSGVISELSELLWAALGPVMTVIPSAGLPKVDSGSIDWSERVVFLRKELALEVVAADGRLAEGA